MGAKVIRKGKKLADIIKRLDDHAVTIGVHKDAGSYPSGEKVGQVAIWNEFGTPRTPERSFMRSTFAEKRKKYQAAMAALATAAIRGVDKIPDGMRRIGELARFNVKDKIVKTDTPPNAESTIAKKGRNDPLIDTRRMLESVEVKDAD